MYPAVHYTMGGLWVDYNLMSNVPGLHVIGEANFSDHGANRLGASALMQGLADGYFVLPYTLPIYLAARSANDRRSTRPSSSKPKPMSRARATDGRRERHAQRRFIPSRARLLMWDKCGMARNEAGLREALGKIPALREEFWSNVRIPGTGEEYNQSLERAGRVADYLEFAELMCMDALTRDESCGGHFREEHQTEEGEALRNDDDFRVRLRVGVPGERHDRDAYAASRAVELRKRGAGAKELQMNFKLRIWRQKGGEKEGRLVDYNANDISPDTSFLEMLDEVNERLTEKAKSRSRLSRIAAKASAEPARSRSAAKRTGRIIRRGLPALHAPLQGRRDDHVEPFRARSFPFVRDLVVNRSALDRIVQAGGYVSARSGSAPEANSIPCRSTMLTWQWKQLRASAAERAPPPAQMHRRCCSLPRRLRISRCFRRGIRNARIGC
jgi:hypothetical protein